MSARKSWPSQLFSWAACLLIILLGSCAAFGQSSCAVTIPIVVAPDEESGGATKNPKKFSIKVDGIAVSPKDFPARVAAKRVAILLQVSSGLQQSGKQLAAETIKALDPSDEVTLVEFSTKGESSIGPTTDHKFLMSVVGTAGEVKRRTAIFDTMAEVIRRVDNDAIIIFTDGADDASSIKEAELKDLVAQSEARIFTFVFVAMPRWASAAAGNPIPGAYEVRFEPSRQVVNSRRIVDEVVNLSGGIGFLPWQWNLQVKGNPARAGRGLHATH